MNKEVLHRGRLGEGILRDDPFTQYYQDKMESYFDRLIEARDETTILKIHAQMIAMSEMVEEFAGWYRMAKLEEDETTQSGETE